MVLIGGVYLAQRHVTAPCGGSRPMGKRARRAKRVPRGAEFFDRINRIYMITKVAGE